MIATISTSPRWKRNASTAATSASAAALRSIDAGIERIPAQRPGAHFLDVREQHVQHEPEREVEDHADHRGGDRGERARKPVVGAQLLDERRAGEDQQHRRHEGDPGRQCGTDDAGGDGRERLGGAIGAEKADELRHLDERPGQGFGQAQAVHHLRGGHPADRSRPPPVPCRKAARRRRRSSPRRAWRRTGRCRRAHGRRPAARRPARPAPTTGPGRPPRRVAAWRQRPGAAAITGCCSGLQAEQRGRRESSRPAPRRRR